MQLGSDDAYYQPDSLFRATGFSGAAWPLQGETAQVYKSAAAACIVEPPHSGNMIYNTTTPPLGGFLQLTMLRLAGVHANSLCLPTARVRPS